MTLALNNADIQTHLQQLPGWHWLSATRSIQKEWVFDRFTTALAFFQALGELAEALDHHPDCWSSYTRMRIQLTTHDAHGLTDKDFQLAAQIERMLEEKFAGQFSVTQQTT